LAALRIPCWNEFSKAEVDSCRRTGVPSDLAEKPNASERENREFLEGDELKICVASCCARPRPILQLPSSANASVRLSE
jgi:hypothetical protein